MLRTQPIEITIWEGCTGTEKIVVLQEAGKKVAVKVPRGIRDGQKIRIKDGLQTYIIPVILTGDGIHTLEHQGTLTRQETLPKTLMSNGGQIQVTTPYGPINLTIPPDTREGTHLILKGWGYPQRTGTSARGDLIITITKGEEFKQSVGGQQRTSDRTIISKITEILVNGSVSIALLIAILIYIPYFFAYPALYALSDGDPQHAGDIIKWNLTHFPPSQGPTIHCVKDALSTPEAEALTQKALKIGKDLESQHGYEMTKRTRIGVFQSLGAHAGVAHYTGGENCIQLELNSYDLENTIRHEWAHIAANREIEDPAHGPEWRKIAQAFGANTAPYRHCESGDYACQARY